MYLPCSLFSLSRNPKKKVQEGLDIFTTDIAVFRIWTSERQYESVELIMSGVFVSSHNSCDAAATDTQGVRVVRSVLSDSDNIVQCPK